MIIRSFSGGAVSLPYNLTIVQDGGYFYVFEDAAHADDCDREPLYYIDSGLDPEIGDMAGAEAARVKVRAHYHFHNVEFI